MGFPFFAREGPHIISASTHKRTTLNCTHTNQYSESSWLAASPIVGLFIREIFIVATLAVGRVSHRPLNEPYICKPCSHEFHYSGILSCLDQWIFSDVSNKRNASTFSAKQSTTSNTKLWTFGNCLPRNTAQHPRRFEFSASLLSESQ
jgi:hypothetical protein